MIGAAVMAGAAALGSYMSSRSSAKGQEKANEQNMEIAQKQMDFQREMSNTAHQREVADMRAAGLNPILSATGGPGASSPPGASAEMKDAKTPGVNSALKAIDTMANAFLARELTEKAKQDTDTSLSQQDLNRTNSTLSAAQRGKTIREQDLVEANTSTAKAAKFNIEEDTNVKKSLQNLQQSEIDKNNNFSNLLKEQGVTEGFRARLTSLNGAQAAELLKGLKTEGEISETAYGKAMQYLKRLSDSLPGVRIRAGKTSLGVD
ncbi:MAG: DNA pilot protein [Microviridae sp.]|nr:MAG: DNA pilot protein [Microviridae sp.]